MPMPRAVLVASLVAVAGLAACGSDPLLPAPASADGSGGGGAGGTATGAGGAATGAGGAAASTGSTSGSSSSGATTSGGHGGAGGSGDALDTSFVFVGCNRLQKADWDPASNPSSANLPELSQTFADVVAMQDRPDRFFFTGDLVLGLVSDTTVLAGQLDGWAALHAADPSGIAAKVPLIPLVGNHEMLAKVKANGSKVELSNPGADDVWTTWAAAHGYDAHAGNGPTPAGDDADALADDQSRLSYSFDAGDVHYVVLDTDTWTTTPDPATGDTQIGWMPLKWLTADLASAQANGAVKHVVLLGHKPVVSPTGDATSDGAVNPALTGALEALLDATPKVRGYFCAHAHLWDARKLPGQRGVYQIVAGNGGSQLEASWGAPTYGFTEVRIYASGKVGVVSWQRPVPATYDQGPTSAAVPEPELVISP
jgi:hypothetical protein